MGLEKSFRATWSEALKKYGFTQISNVFLKHYSDLGITSEEALFIIHCFKFKWSIKKPYPSFNTVAKEMGKSRGAAQRYARHLERKGFIKRYFREGDSNEIDLQPLIVKLEESCANLHKVPVQKRPEPYSKLDTKEDPPRRTINSGENNGMESAGGIINRKYGKP